MESAVVSAAPMCSRSESASFQIGCDSINRRGANPALEVGLLSSKIDDPPIVRGGDRLSHREEVLILESKLT